MADIRYNNSFSLAGGFNITNAEPIDSRMYVADIQHIYLAENWVKVKPYPGLIVSAPSGEVRICVNADFTKEESWKKIGGGNVSVETFAEAEELAVEANIGQVIYVSGESVAYIVSGEGVLMKLATSTAGDIDSIVAALQAEVKALQNVVGKEATDEAEATGLIKAVADNATAIAELKAIDHDAYKGADAALKEELQEEIAGKVAQEEYDAKVEELEGAITEAIEAAAQDAQDKADAATAAANKHADELNVAMDERVKTLEDIDHDAYKGADAALKEELQNAMTESLAGKVNVEEGKRLMTDAEGTKLAAIADGAQVNVIETVKVNGTALDVTDKTVNIEIESIKVKGVDGTDKMLSLTENGEVKSELHIEYVKAEDSDDNKPYIALYGKGGTMLIDSFDATDFIKDGMIDSVQLVDTVDGSKALEITWNTDAGKEVVSVPVGDLMDYYYAGNGIALSDDRKFSVDLKEGERFLVVDALGLGINETELWAAADGKYDAKGAAAQALEDAKADAQEKASQALEDAIADAAEKYQVKGDYEVAGAAAKALEDAIADAAEKYQVKGDYEVAGAAAKALEDAIADAAEKYQVKGDYEVAGAADAVKTYANETFVSKEGFNEFTTTMESKLENIEEGAQVNKIESVKVNGIDASIEGKVASVTVGAVDMTIGTAITTDGTELKEDESNLKYSADTKVSVVLQGISTAIKAAAGEGVKSITASDNSVEVNANDENNPTIRVKVSSDADNLLSVKNNGLFVGLYYEGDDVE